MSSSESDREKATQKAENKVIARSIRLAAMHSSKAQTIIKAREERKKAKKDIKKSGKKNNKKANKPKQKPNINNCL